MNRFQDALFVQSACNLHALAKLLDRAIADCKAQGITDGDAIRADPAIRLIVYQMAFLTGQEFGMPLDEYVRCTLACEAKSSAAAVAMVGSLRDKP